MKLTKLYRGKVAFVMESKGYLFIQRDSIHQLESGAPCDITLKKDLFFHVRENPAVKIKNVVPGQTLIFAIATDHVAHRPIACDAVIE